MISPPLQTKCGDPPIPPRLWQTLIAFLSDVRAGKWPGGAQVTLNVSGQGIVTSLEAKGRDVPEAPVERR